MGSRSSGKTANAAKELALGERVGQKDA